MYIYFIKLLFIKEFLFELPHYNCHNVQAYIYDALSKLSFNFQLCGNISSTLLSSHKYFSSIQSGLSEESGIIYNTAYLLLFFNIFQSNLCTQNM